MSQRLGKARGCQLTQAHCALAAGRKAEQREGALNQLVPARTCTHTFTCAYTKCTHMHLYKCAHTHRSFKGLTSSFRTPTLGCPSFSRAEKGRLPAPKTPLPGKSRPGFLEAAPEALRRPQ